MLLCLDEFGVKCVSSDSRMGSEFVDRRVVRVAAASGERLVKENLSKEKNLLIPDGGLPVFGVREALPSCCGLCPFELESQAPGMLVYHFHDNLQALAIGLTI